ncbi:hypothetical protein E4T50_12372 [Aureobasidium sp. EXF-12298]|nr:hypothetical protein E4T50_12372 [Aureobasidium sp. EXF-12298]KAI4758243.1 hypothetical protein E4T51_08714 [Aureobasidium sp. EXF-12344]KAI4774382.1 hypothetical protein E4T52_10653 [Aureobasidium sp. EXF-3400]
MLRRTSQCLSRRPLSRPRARCLSTTVPQRLATPTSGFAPTWDKIKETLKPPIDQFMPKTRPSYTLDTPLPAASDHLSRTCTVLTSNPSITTLQQLLDRIPQFQQANESGLFTDFLLLVTPSYAASLRNQKNVIEQALTRIFPVKELDEDTHNSLGGDSREAVRLVAAVVDRLPKPSELSASAVGDTGSEGIAIRLIANENPIWKPELATDDPRAALSDNKFRFLSFHLNDPSTPPHMLPIVQLPLANTIFHNGLSSTLIWRKYAVQQGGKGLTQIDEQVCDSHRVKLPQQAGAYEINTLALSVPLVPLTSARSVVACMGNIIRRLSANSGLGPADDTQEAILASHELEQSVTSYHKTRGLSPRAVSVWALVIPEKTFTGGLSMAAKVLGERDLPELWKAGSDHDTDPSQPNLLTLLQNGARLHKVLSGGGGWGKKAGLLSLDPDTGYGQHPSWEEIAPAQQTEPEYIQGLSPVPADLHRAWGFEPQELPSIVNKGDYIQFYISPSASSEEATAQSESTMNTSDQTMSNVKTVEFGSIPSTVDDMPSSQASSAAAQSVVQTYPNHFGALSETGIAMFFGLQSDKASSSNIHNATDAATKVDVPFGRFRSRSQISAASSKPKQAETGFGFSPTKSLQSMIRGHRISRQLLIDQAKTAYAIQKRNIDSSSVLMDEPVDPKHSDGTIWQSAPRSAISRRKLKKTMRIPKIPNKNWTSKDINEARKALIQAEPDTGSSGLVFRNLKAMTRSAADTPLAQDFISGLKGQRLQSWAEQTMRDVISPMAFEQWEKDETIPKEPNDTWSDKDIRKAHTFKKRQWKLQKAANRQSYLDKVPLATRTMKDVLASEAFEQWEKDKTIPKEPNDIWSKTDIRRALFFRRQKWELHKTPKSLKLDAIPSIPKQLQQQKASAHRHEQEAKAESPEEKAGIESATRTIASLRLQAQARARSRVLQEAFRGLLSPAQQHRASLQKASKLSKTSRISEPQLTKRVMHLITMHEPGCPRIRIYELLNSHRSAPIREMNSTIEWESKSQARAEHSGRDLASQEESQEKAMQETEMRDQLGKWKTAAEELREAIDLKWPEEGKKKRLKDVVEKEMEEIGRVEKSVQGFLVG